MSGLRLDSVGFCWAVCCTMLSMLSAAYQTLLLPREQPPPRSGHSAQILFTDINLGASTRGFASSGPDDAGSSSGAYTTFWNIDRWVCGAAAVCSGPRSWVQRPCVQGHEAWCSAAWCSGGSPRPLGTLLYPTAPVPTLLTVLTSASPAPPALHCPLQQLRHPAAA